MATQAGVPIRASYGYVVIGAGATPANPNAASDTNFFIIDNSETVIEAGSVEDDVTTSFNTVGTRAFAGLQQNRVSITLPEDDPSSLESVSLVKGAYYTVWCRRGTSTQSNSQWDKVVNACFMGLRKNKPTATGQKITVTAEFVGGDYTGYTQASTALAAYLTSSSRT